MYVCGDEGRGGSTYVRWGRTTCESSSTLVYSGTFALYGRYNLCYRQ